MLLNRTPKAPFSGTKKLHAFFVAQFTQIEKYILRSNGKPNVRPSGDYQWAISCCQRTVTGNPSPTYRLPSCHCFGCLVFTFFGYLLPTFWSSPFWMFSILLKNRPPQVFSPSPSALPPIRGCGWAQNKTKGKKVSDPKDDLTKRFSSAAASGIQSRLVGCTRPLNGWGRHRLDLNPQRRSDWHHFVDAGIQAF